MATNRYVKDPFSALIKYSEGLENFVPAAVPGLTLLALYTAVQWFITPLAEHLDGARLEGHPRFYFYAMAFPSTIVEILLMIAFLRAVCTNPGKTPQEWKLWDGEGDHPPLPRHSRFSSMFESKWKESFGGFKRAKVTTVKYKPKDVWQHMPTLEEIRTLGVVVVTTNAAETHKGFGDGMNWKRGGEECSHGGHGGHGDGGHGHSHGGNGGGDNHGHSHGSQPCNEQHEHQWAETIGTGVGAGLSAVGAVGAGIGALAGMGGNSTRPKLTKEQIENFDPAAWRQERKKKAYDPFAMTSGSGSTSSAEREKRDVKSRSTSSSSSSSPSAADTTADESRITQEAVERARKWHAELQMDAPPPEAQGADFPIQLDWEQLPEMKGMLGMVDGELIKTLANPYKAQLTYCQACESWRPPRSHHCKRCGVCVLRMDHHCVFLGQCVGVANWKFFWLFCIYSTCGTGLWFFYLALALLSGKVSIFSLPLLVLAGVYGALLKFTFGLVKYHTKRGQENVTQLEYMFHPHLASKYNWGTPTANLSLPLGKNQYLWPFPFFAGWTGIHDEPQIYDLELPAAQLNEPHGENAV